MLNCLKYILCVLFLSANFVFAVEIPLEKGSDKVTFGFVDMDRLFAENDKVSKSKQDYQKLQDDRNNELNAKKTEIGLLESEIKNLENEIPNIRVNIERLESSSQAGAIPAQASQQPSSSTYSQPQVTVSTSAALPAPVMPAPSVSSSQTVSQAMPRLSSQTVVLPAISSFSVNTESVGNSSDTERISRMKERQKQLLMQMSTQAVSAGVVDNTSPLDSERKKLDEAQKSLAQKKEMLITKKKDYESRKTAVAAELKDFENNNTLKVMAEYYKVIEELAKEENISVIVDKTGILYGNSKVDLTDKIKDRLRGR